MDRDEADLRRQIGKKLSRLRERLRLSAEEVADRAEVSSKQYVTELERGERGIRLPTLARLVEAGLDSSLGELFVGIQLRPADRAGEPAAWYEDRRYRPFARLANRVVDLPEEKRQGLLRLIAAAVDLAEKET